MSKWDEQILVVNREQLFNNEKYDFYGFLSNDNEKVKNIVDNFKFYEVKRRGDMEEDPTYKQLIGYIVVKDKDTKNVLVYKRLVGGGESRLHGKASVGVGGHMNEIENNSIYDMLKVNAARELKEEIDLDEEYAVKNLNFVGLINDDKEEVGKVHIGVVYICEVDKNNIKVMEDDTLKVKWCSGDEAREEENYESWSEFLKPIM